MSAYIRPIAHPGSAAFRAVVRKEFREFRNHRMILITAAGLPVVFMLLPFLNLVGIPGDASSDRVNLAIGQAMFTFFLTPVIVPAALAAYSVIGEKEQDTLEPLLTLPMTDRELIHAKLFAILLPSVAASIAVYACFLALSAVLVHGAARPEVFSSEWPAGVVLMAAPLALYSTLTGMSISARARDLRVAEQLAGLVILPTLVPIALIAFRMVPVNAATWAAFFAIVAAIDVVLLRVTYRTFSRERAVAMSD